MAKESMEQNRKSMASAYDRKRKQARAYQIGDRVWLEVSNITSNRPSKKLDYRRYGPFPISEIIGNGAYRLELPSQWVIHDVFNEALLSPARKPEFLVQQQPPPPPPDLVDAEEEWEVEEI
ncbi:hypothetical protein AN958_06128 [Leucoagaricus sp. SymC.cos]|nr:hypothetical protein AN958_06128 [Leucoagaricus sp. SymC.cos]